MPRATRVMLSGMGMQLTSRTARAGVLGALLATLLIAGGTATTATAATPTTPTTSTAVTTAAPATVGANAIGDICYTDLPPEAWDTLDLIWQGGPYPYPQDDGIFYNREGLLPDQPTGYYHEYTVETPGLDHRGARRIVTGNSYLEDYYTSDHYASFDLIDYYC